MNFYNRMIYFKILLIITPFTIFLQGCSRSYEDYLMKEDMYENAQLASLHKKYAEQLHEIVKYCGGYDWKTKKEWLFPRENGIRFVSKPNGIFLYFPLYYEQLVWLISDSTQSVEAARKVFDDVVCRLLLGVNAFSEKASFAGFILNIEADIVPESTKIVGIDVYGDISGTGKWTVPRVLCKRTLFEYYVSLQDGITYSNAYPHESLGETVVKAYLSFGTSKPAEIDPKAKRVLSTKTKVYVNGKEVSDKIGTFPENYELKFKDNFVDNSNNWAKRDDEFVTLKIDSSKYIFDRKQSTGLYLTWRNFPVNEEDNFSIECNITHVSGVINSGFGIAWGVKDADNASIFLISDSGAYWYGYRSEEKWYYYINWTKSPAIQTNNSRNKLMIKKIGNQVELYINDNHVNSAQAIKFFDMKFGFAVERNQRVEINNIKVVQWSP